MLFLLRKIRRKLVSPNNKVATYLLYAIGEIFLVVVGIMIAVQIDGWNDNQKEKRVLQEYLQNLKADLVADTLRIDALQKRSLDNLEQISNYQKIYDSGNWTLKTLVENSEMPLAYIRYFPVKSTFEEMVNTGSLKLIDSDLRREMKELKATQDQLVIITDKVIGDLKKSRYDEYRYLDLDVFEGDFYETTGLKQSDEDLAMGLKYRHLTMKGFNDIHGLIHEFGDQIIDKSAALIEKIDMQLEQ
ncbi:MAG: hypothetical protein ACI83W_000948 [Marinoscillum sp.]|jgi:hypothetical protein